VRATSPAWAKWPEIEVFASPIRGDTSESVRIIPHYPLSWRGTPVGVVREVLALAGRTQSVAKGGIGAFRNVLLYPVPVSLIVTNLFAEHADRKKSRELSHVSERLLQGFYETVIASEHQPGRRATDGCRERDRQGVRAPVTWTRVNGFFDQLEEKHRGAREQPARASAPQAPWTVGRSARQRGPSTFLAHGHRRGQRSPKAAPYRRPACP